MLVQAVAVRTYGKTTSTEPFNVVVVCADRQVTFQILEKFDRIQAALLEEQPFEIHLWRLDLLKESALLVEASRDEAGADMIVVNLNDERLGSELFQCWAESWPEASPDKPQALVGFQPGDHLPLSAQTFHHLEPLRNLASRKHMDFITNESVLEANAHALPVAQNEARVKLRPTVLLETFKHEPVLGDYQRAAYRDYGINE